MSDTEAVGLIPAAGRAKRMGHIPCSKEILPVGFYPGNDGSKAHVKVVISYLLERMQLAGILKAYIILREDKFDIPAFLGNGSLHGIHLCYLIRGVPYGVPYTLDQAFPFVQNAIVALGFPDTIYENKKIYSRLMEELRKSDADVVLGLFPADQPRNADGVEVDSEGIVRRVIAKPQITSHKLVWAAAVWMPTFSRFMHEYLKELDPILHAENELQIGQVVQAAIKHGQKVASVNVSNKFPIDVGTTNRLAQVLKKSFDDMQG